MSTDPRADRTRRLICDAVIALSKAGNTSPSVSAVVREAGVNRSSFYAHFDSLEDVACDMLNDSLGQIAELGWVERRSNTSSAQGVRDLRALVAHVRTQHGFYRSVLATGEYSARAQTHVAELLRTRFEDSLLRYGALDVVSATKVSATATAAGAAVAALVTAWLRGELVCSEDHLATYCAETMPQWAHELPIQGAHATPS